MNNASHGLSRRAFLRDAGLVGMSAAAAAALGGCSSPKSKSESETTTAEVVTEELPVPEVSAPSTTAYDCDVLVIGGGFAGMNAAMAAKNAGCNVVLVDKGRPGYSGLSPWPSSHRWFDPDMGDDAEAFRTAIQRGGEYVVNLDWYQQWIDHSKEAYERLVAWGIMDRYDRAADTSIWDTLDYQAYYDMNAEHDRHARVVPLLQENGITVVDYTMITNVEKDGDRIVGAVGLHVPSATIISFNAKAIVMAMGGGSYKPTGYPVGGNTFDGEYIAYNLGLPIAGKEYDDFHATTSFAPGCSFINNNWDYLENIWLCGGDITADTAASYATSKEKTMVMGRVTGTINGASANDGTNIEHQATADITRRGGTVTDNPDDIRIGKMMSPKPKADVYGAALGMSAHMSNGVFCGLDDLEGYTGIPGLWVAGDGANASAPTGAAYPVGVGFTSNYASIQGDIAGKAAAAYAQTASAGSISSDRLAKLSEEILAPLSVETGFSPDGARDQLQAIMSPYWVLVAQDEATLQATLTQVINMRDKVIPKLAASNPHQLRMAIEMKHKVLSAELKLRANLERKESRGLHFRTDYPFRDDKNFLCYITLTKGEDGEPIIERVPVKDEWKGDTSEDYATRYGVRFPTEAKTLGLPEEQSGSSWGK